MARTNLTLKQVRVPVVLDRAEAIKEKFDDHDDALDTIELSGTVPSARLNMATNPTTTNTVVIGGHTFTFLTALAAAGATTQIKIGASAAATRALLIKAINGVADATNITPATVPHTVAVVADEIDTSRVRVRLADAKGGTAIAAAKAAGGSSIAVSETLAAAADVWDRTNLNLTGHVPAGKFAMSTVAITAAMIAAGKVYLEFEFTPTEVMWQSRSAVGVPLLSNDDVVIEGNGVKIALAGGVAPNLVATNVVAVFVTG